MSGILAALVGGSGGRLLTVGNVSTAYGYTTGLYGDFAPREFLGTTVKQLNWEPNTLRFGVTNTALPNSGWESLNVNGTVFLRSAASYSLGVWAWSGISTNPIGTSVGAVIPVTIA